MNTLYVVYSTAERAWMHVEQGWVRGLIQATLFTKPPLLLPDSPEGEMRVMAVGDAVNQIERLT